MALVGGGVGTEYARMVGLREVRCAEVRLRGAWGGGSGGGGSLRGGGGGSRMLVCRQLSYGRQVMVYGWLMRLGELGTIVHVMLRGLGVLGPRVRPVGEHGGRGRGCVYMVHRLQRCGGGRVVGYSLTLYTGTAGLATAARGVGRQPLEEWTYALQHWVH